MSSFQCKYIYEDKSNLGQRCMFVATENGYCEKCNEQFCMETVKSPNSEVENSLNSKNLPSTE